jgi:hypothetical protein
VSSVPATEIVDEGLRFQIITDIRNDRKNLRFTEVPQVIVMTMLLITLAGVSSFGLITAIAGLKNASGTLTQTINLLKLFVGGSSSILGFVVLRLSKRLSEITKLYLLEQKRFTSDINRIRLCTTEVEMEAILKQYYKSLK